MLQTQGCCARSARAAELSFSVHTREGDDDQESDDEKEMEAMRAHKRVKYE